jgi:NADH:ubiquinone oxidoreductase subunit C
MELYVAIESVLDALREVVRTFAGPGERHALVVRQGLINEVWVTVPARCIRPAVQRMVKELDIWHLSTITASDLWSPDRTSADNQPDGLEVLYHFWMGRGLSLRCTLPYEDPHLDSVSDLIPGAAFYEREVSEMLGITFRYVAGHERPEPGWLLLPDDWEGGAPLRHDYEPGQER